MLKLVISTLIFIAFLWMLAAFGSVILYASVVVLTIAAIFGLIKLLLTAEDNTGV